jgi:hypothetical protein
MVSTTTPNPELTQILTDLEFGGGRNTTDFAGVCNRNQAFYGAKASALRRKYQYVVDRLGPNKKSAIDYCNIVIESGVVPSRATVHDAKMEELRKSLAKAQLEDQTVATKPTATVAKAPAVLTPPRPKTPPVNQQVQFQVVSSPNPSVLSATDETAAFDLSGGDVDPTIGWSVDNPHIIWIQKLNAPLPHGFTGLFSDTVEGLGSYERDVYFITKTIGGDLKHWSASIPADDMFPNYKGRCVLIQGPSTDYVHSDKDTLLDSLTATLSLPKNEIPPNIGAGIKRAFSKLSNYLQRDSAKRTAYYLCVYPPGTVFDNQAISGDGAANQIKTFGIRVNKKFSIFQKKEHTNVLVFWAIATRADEERRTDGFSAVLSSDVFDF